MKDFINYLVFRWKAQSTKAGKILARLVVICQVIIMATVTGAEYFNFIPTDFVPSWLKVVVGVIAFGGYVGGNLTVKKNG